MRAEELRAALVADPVHAGREQGPLACADQETHLRLGQRVLDDADDRGVCGRGARTPWAGRVVAARWYCCSIMTRDLFPGPVNRLSPHPPHSSPLPVPA